MTFCKKLELYIWKILSIVADFFFFFLRNNKNFKLMFLLLKFGNSGQRNLLISKIILNSRVFSRLANSPREFFQLLNLSNGNNIKIWKNLINSKFFNSCFDKSFLEIFDFFYQNFSKNKVFNHQNLAYFFFPQFFSLKKLEIFKKNSILIFYASMIFSSHIESRVLYFQKLWIGFLSKIPHIFCSTFIQFILSIFFKLNNFRFDKKINSEILKNLNFIIPSKIGFEFFLNIVKHHSIDKFDHYKIKAKKQKNFVKKKWFILIYFLKLPKFLIKMQKKKEKHSINLFNDEFIPKIQKIKYILLLCTNSHIQSKNDKVFYRVLKKKFKEEGLLNLIKKKDLDLIKNIFICFIKKKRKKNINYLIIRLSICYLRIKNSKFNIFRGQIHCNFVENKIFGSKKLMYYNFIFFFSQKKKKKNILRVFLIVLVLRFFLHYNFKKKILCFYENFLGNFFLKIEKKYIFSSIIHPLEIFPKYFSNLSWVYQTLEE